MRVKRFVGPSTREVLSAVRAALGEEAVILANRSHPEGVEILACSGEEFTDVVSPADVKESSPAAQSPQMSAAPRTQGSATDHTLEQVLREIRAMKEAMSSLQSPAPALSSATPLRSAPASPEGQQDLLERLRDIGLSRGLARYLADRLPAGISPEGALDWARSALIQNLKVQPDEQELLEDGGVFALVGPTGVGKTTTTAKLAARVVMRHGSNQLALITTDGYRIGAQEQLRIYGRILGSMVHAVRDEADLGIAVNEFSGRRTVLIDTVGMSQRDQMVAEQVAMFGRMDRPVKRLLCLNSTSTLETLDEVVQAYRGSGLAGVVITKTDEAARLGHVLDIVLRHRLPVYYVSTGQRVPEDLEVPTADWLVGQAFARVPVLQEA